MVTPSANGEAGMTKMEKSKGTNRPATHYDIHCPVTVQVPSRLNGTAQVEGELWEISEHGARVFLGKPLAPGTEILLFAHFRHPHKGISTIRFRGVVETLKDNPRYEMTVGFGGNAKFVPEVLPRRSDVGGEGRKSSRS